MIVSGAGSKWGNLNPQKGGDDESVRADEIQTLQPKAGVAHQILTRQ